MLVVQSFLLAVFVALVTCSLNEAADVLGNVVFILDNLQAGKPTSATLSITLSALNPAIATDKFEFEFPPSTVTTLSSVTATAISPADAAYTCSVVSPVTVTCTISNAGATGMPPSSVVIFAVSKVMADTAPRGWSVLGKMTLYEQAGNEKSQTFNKLKLMSPVVDYYGTKPYKLPSSDIDKDTLSSSVLSIAVGGEDKTVYAVGVATSVCKDLNGNACVQLWNRVPMGLADYQLNMSPIPFDGPLCPPRQFLVAPDGTSAYLVTDGSCADKSLICSYTRITDSSNLGLLNPMNPFCRSKSSAGGGISFNAQLGLEAIDRVVQSYDGKHMYLFSTDEIVMCPNGNVKINFDRCVKYTPAFSTSQYLPGDGTVRAAVMALKGDKVAVLRGRTMYLFARNSETGMLTFDQSDVASTSASASGTSLVINTAGTVVYVGLVDGETATVAALVAPGNDFTLQSTWTVALPAGLVPASMTLSGDGAALFVAANTSGSGTAKLFTVKLAAPNPADAADTGGRMSLLAGAESDELGANVNTLVSSHDGHSLYAAIGNRLIPYHATGLGNGVVTVDVPFFNAGASSSAAVVYTVEFYVGTTAVAANDIVVLRFPNGAATLDAGQTFSATVPAGSSVSNDAVWTKTVVPAGVAAGSDTVIALKLVTAPAMGYSPSKSVVLELRGMTHASVTAVVTAQGKAVDHWKPVSGGEEVLVSTSLFMWPALFDATAVVVGIAATSPPRAMVADPVTSVSLKLSGGLQGNGKIMIAWVILSSASAAHSVGGAGSTSSCGVENLRYGAQVMYSMSTSIIQPMTFHEPGIYAPCFKADIGASWVEQTTAAARLAVHGTAMVTKSDGSALPLEVDTFSPVHLRMVLQPPPPFATVFRLSFDTSACACTLATGPNDSAAPTSSYAPSADVTVPHGQTVYTGIWFQCTATGNQMPTLLMTSVSGSAYDAFTSAAIQVAGNLSVLAASTGATLASTFAVGETTQLEVRLVSSAIVNTAVEVSLVPSPSSVATACVFSTDGATTAPTASTPFASAATVTITSGTQSFNGLYFKCASPSLFSGVALQLKQVSGDKHAMYISSGMLITGSVSMQPLSYSGAALLPPLPQSVEAVSLQATGSFAVPLEVPVMFKLGLVPAAATDSVLRLTVDAAANCGLFTLASGCAAVATVDLSVKAGVAEVSTFLKCATAPAGSIGFSLASVAGTAYTLTAAEVPTLTVQGAIQIVPAASAVVMPASCLSALPASVPAEKSTNFKVRVFPAAVKTTKVAITTATASTATCTLMNAASASSSPSSGGGSTVTVEVLSGNSDSDEFHVTCSTKGVADPTAATVALVASASPGGDAYLAFSSPLLSVAAANAGGGSGQANKGTTSMTEGSGLSPEATMGISIPAGVLFVIGVSIFCYIRYQSQKEEEREAEIQQKYGHGPRDDHHDHLDMDARTIGELMGSALATGGQYGHSHSLRSKRDMDMDMDEVSADGDLELMERMHSDVLDNGDVWTEQLDIGFDSDDRALRVDMDQEQPVSLEIDTETGSGTGLDMDMDMRVYAAAVSSPKSGSVGGGNAKAESVPNIAETTYSSPTSKLQGVLNSPSKSRKKADRKHAEDAIRSPSRKDRARSNARTPAHAAVAAAASSSVEEKETAFNFSGMESPEQARALGSAQFPCFDYHYDHDHHHIREHPSGLSSLVLDPLEPGPSLASLLADDQAPEPLGFVGFEADHAKAAADSEGQGEDGSVTGNDGATPQTVGEMSVSVSPRKEVMSASASSPVSTKAPAAETTMTTPRGHDLVTASSVSAPTSASTSASLSTSAYSSPSRSRPASPSAVVAADAPSSYESSLSSTARDMRAKRSFSSPHTVAGSPAVIVASAPAPPAVSVSSPSQTAGYSSPSHTTAYGVQAGTDMVGPATRAKSVVDTVSASKKTTMLKVVHSTTRSTPRKLMYQEDGGYFSGPTLQLPDFEDDYFGNPNAHVNADDGAAVQIHGSNRADSPSGLSVPRGGISGPGVKKPSMLPLLSPILDRTLDTSMYTYQQPPSPLPTSRPVHARTETEVVEPHSSASASPSLPSLSASLLSSSSSSSLSGAAQSAFLFSPAPVAVVYRPKPTTEDLVRWTRHVSPLLAPAVASQTSSAYATTDEFHATVTLARTAIDAPEEAHLTRAHEHTEMGMEMEGEEAMLSGLHVYEYVDDVATPFRTRLNVQMYESPVTAMDVAEEDGQGDDNDNSFHSILRAEEP